MGVAHHEPPRGQLPQRGLQRLRLVAVGPRAARQPLEHALLKAGTADFYRGSHRELFPGRRLSKQEFTFQLSDHLPLWVEVATG
ncbi:MAG: hypothetical protein EOO74_04355 [Myxococcales bacterium]|nr:MAG: hypothetical protein EOO74_04355 [Myxococcales bacterium]